MTEDVIEHAFEPFYTTKGVGEGTGLGLSMVYSLIERHDAVIEIESEVGNGATFTMYFPRTTTENNTKPVGLVSTESGMERILVVDDDELVLNMLEATLTSQGYRVVPRRNGLEALETFKLDPDGFELVISDVQMPKMTGKELIEEIFSIRASQNIILCTGHSQLITEDEATAQGVRCFLTKPIPRQTLTNSIRQVLDRKTA